MKRSSIVFDRLHAAANRLLILGVGMWLASCATVVMHTPSGQEIEMSHDEFTKYLEQVNSLNSQVSDALVRSMGECSDEEIEDPAQLMVAGRKMVRACEPFKQIISASLLYPLTGKEPNLDNVNSVPACQEASEEVQELMRY